MNRLFVRGTHLEIISHDRTHRVSVFRGAQCNDHDGIWNVLDEVLKKHPSMVLIHGGGATGAERIAACWAANQKVTEIAFKPVWKGAGDKSAPFKRNDRILEVMPIGLVVLPGNGITDNLADKAKRMGIPVKDKRTA